jgi:hypothetical protein
VLILEEALEPDNVDMVQRAVDLDLGLQLWDWE